MALRVILNEKWMKNTEKGIEMHRKDVKRHEKNWNLLAAPASKCFFHYPPRPPRLSGYHESSPCSSRGVRVASPVPTWPNRFKDMASMKTCWKYERKWTENEENAMEKDKKTYRFPLKLLTWSSLWSPDAWACPASAAAPRCGSGATWRPNSASSQEAAPEPARVKRNLKEEFLRKIAYHESISYLHQSF